MADRARKTASQKPAPAANKALVGPPENKTPLPADDPAVPVAPEQSHPAPAPVHRASGFLRPKSGT
jgi:hypothetical protein